MSEGHRTPSDRPSKPAKPYPDFPLTAHPAGYWCKKIRGKIHYFGPWSDPEGALQRYNEQKDDLHSGRTPRPDPAALTVKDAANAFLNAKAALVDSGELSPHTFGGYRRAAEELVSHAGKARLVSDLRPADFTALRNKMAAKWRPATLGLMVVCVRAVFKHVFDSGLIDTPVRFGPVFKGPSKKTMRIDRAGKGPRLFAAEEIRRLIEAANPALKAMLLLGINCGFGNADCGNLSLPAVNLDAGWIDFPRPKTGMPRRCPLWPETVAALRESLARRKEPRDPEAAGLVFITYHGAGWSKPAATSAIVREVMKLLKRLGINGRHRLGFYTLRHTFRTIADGAKDQPAADLIMGHEVAHMSSVYREVIEDARLKAVSDHVRKWVFPPEEKAEAEAGPAAEVASSPPE
ncbi:MAG TPA: tyrosine-type recombinase/integrase [Gemmataceae bacterium]|nr:tyrosine-type recombinase/integrase [Gemmataceae bacterium]